MMVAGNLAEAAASTARAFTYARVAVVGLLCTTVAALVRLGCERWVIIGTMLLLAAAVVVSFAPPEVVLKKG